MDADKWVAEIRKDIDSGAAYPGFVEVMLCTPDEGILRYDRWNRDNFIKEFFDFALKYRISGFFRQHYDENGKMGDTAQSYVQAYVLVMEPADENGDANITPELFDALCEVIGLTS